MLPLLPSTMSVPEFAEVSSRVWSNSQSELRMPTPDFGLKRMLKYLRHLQNQRLILFTTDLIV